MASASSYTFIYGLIDPRTNECRYVGKANNPVERLKDHYYYAKPTTHKGSWLSGLKSAEIWPELVILENPETESWEEAERFWISYLSFLGCKLTNMSSGGDGLHNPSLETRIKIGNASKGRPGSKAMLGKKHSPETCAHYSAIRLGVPLSEEHRKNISAGLKGKVKSEEHRLKLSAARKGSVATDELKQRLSEIQKKLWENNPVRRELTAKSSTGRVHSPETKAKISAANKGRKMSKASVERIAELRRGVKLSPEHKANISESSKIAWAKRKGSLNAIC